jgi:hypothetical protein
MVTQVTLASLSSKDLNTVVAKYPSSPSKSNSFLTSPLGGLHSNGGLWGGFKETSLRSTLQSSADTMEGITYYTSNQGGVCRRD